MAAIANVQLSDTFNQWRVRTNVISTRLNQFAINESRLYANTLNANVTFEVVTGAANTNIFSDHMNVTANTVFSGNVNVGKLVSTSTISASAFVGDGSGLSGAGATVARSLEGNHSATPAGNLALLFTGVTSGSLATANVFIATGTSSGLVFNPNTGVLTANSFSGDGSSLTGAGATVNVSLAGQNANLPILFTGVTSGSLATANVETSRLTFNPNTGVLTANSFSGDGSSLTGVASAKGGGTDLIFYESDQNATTNYSITSGKNAMAPGTLTVNSGVTITVPSGSRLVIV
tara:strand:+ start:914 stop:1786 length:873 start_codon:yes stop_codon:yes gene_type:complete